MPLFQGLQDKVDENHMPGDIALLNYHIARVGGPNADPKCLIGKEV